MSSGMNRRTELTAQSRRRAAALRFEPVDKSSFTPLYFQIYTQLVGSIQSGRLHAGDPLPSEEKITRACGVSRMTARQSLQMLKNEGLAVRHRGQGSFVSQPRVEKDIAHLCGFTAEMRGLGMKASSRVLESNIVPASADAATRLVINIGAPIFVLRRLRLADSVPVAIEQASLPRDRFPGIERIDFSRRSLYQTLRERFAIQFSRADEVLEARSARKDEAALLKTQPRASLLVIARVLWSADGRPVEAAHSIYRGDRYRAILRIPATAWE